MKFNREEFGKHGGRSIYLKLEFGNVLRKTVRAYLFLLNFFYNLGLF